MKDSRREHAEAVARRYIGSDQLLKELGSGAEGFVFPTPTSTAVKIFSHKERFDCELAVYQRLFDHDVIEVQGFNIPRLVSFNKPSMVIEMTIVQPPYILDFAQSELDVPR